MYGSLWKKQTINSRSYLQLLVTFDWESPTLAKLLLVVLSGSSTWNQIQELLEPQNSFCGLWKHQNQLSSVWKGLVFDQDTCRFSFSLHRNYLLNMSWHRNIIAYFTVQTHSFAMHIRSRIGWSLHRATIWKEKYMYLGGYFRQPPHAQPEGILCKLLTFIAYKKTMVT